MSEDRSIHVDSGLVTTGTLNFVTATLGPGASADFPNSSGMEAVGGGITAANFRRFIEGIATYTLTTHGDRREREFQKFEALSKRLPNYERYWRMVITPATNRIHDEASIGLRSDISDDVHLLCHFNYSVLSSILRAWHHSLAERDGVYADFFSSLQSSCEQIELLMLTRRVVFGGDISWEEILDTTDGLRNDRLRAEQLEHLDVVDSDAWRNFRGVCREISLIRNALCHGPEIAVYVDESGEVLAPAISMHDRLLWTRLPEEGDRSSLRKYFKNQKYEMRRILVLYLKWLNELYKVITEQDASRLLDIRVQALYGIPAVQ